MGRLANAVVIGADLLDANQGYVVAFVVIEIFLCVGF